MSIMTRDDAVANPARTAESVRSLIVHVDGAPEASGRLRAAVELARRYDATLLGVGVEMEQPVNDPYGLMSGDWIIEMRRLVSEDLEQAARTFEAATAGVRSEWLGVDAYPSDVIARLSRSADLIVAGGEPLPANNAYRKVSTAELVMASGRPVLVAPPAGGTLRGEAIVVAWKDSRESRRAVTDALPFLRGAAEVVILEVCQADALEEAAAGVADVAHFLRRHGVHACGKTKIAPPGMVTAEIQNEARAIGADLIVAGAYGHSRLGEWAFGGVTFDLLHAPERFVLLSR